MIYLYDLHRHLSNVCNVIEQVPEVFDLSCKASRSWACGVLGTHCRINSINRIINNSTDCILLVLLAFGLKCNTSIIKECSPESHFSQARVLFACMCVRVQFFSHKSTFQLLDKPWSQVLSLLPPGSFLQFFSRIGFSNPTARRISIECC